MKKLLLIVAVITAFSFVSCKKDRTCTCTTTSTATGSTTATTVNDYPKSKKNSAKRECALSSNFNGKMLIFTEVTHHDAVGNNPAYTVTEDCVLK